MLLIAVVMIGTAVAGTIDADMSLDGDPITIDIGETENQFVTLVLSGDATNKDIIKIKILNVPDGISTSIDGTPGTELSDNWGESQTWEISYTNFNAANGNYVVTYQVEYVFDGGTSGTQTRQSSIQTGINAIPEFPTVALPIAAILGLMFIISSRKKKE